MEEPVETSVGLVAETKDGQRLHMHPAVAEALAAAGTSAGSSA